MEPLLKGVLMGITVSLMIGPIFLALADITITKGRYSAFAYILGIIFIDVILIYIIESFFQYLVIADSFKFYVGIIGGALLILFGIATFFSKSEIKAIDVTSIKTLLGAFVKGITINIFNPFVIFWWITMYTTISINYTIVANKLLFYFGILFMVFLFDLIKMRFAYYFRTKLNAQSLSIFKRIVGVCLCIFGIAMILKVV